MDGILQVRMEVLQLQIEILLVRIASSHKHSRVFSLYLDRARLFAGREHLRGDVKPLRSALSPVADENKRRPVEWRTMLFASNHRQLSSAHGG